MSQLLQRLEQARSVEQYNALLKSTTLTPSEQGDLERELAKPHYAGKLERLLRESGAAAETTVRSEARQKSLEIARNQQQSLIQVNQEVDRHHQLQLSKAPVAARAKVSGASVVGRAARAPISLEGLPHITSVSSPITPGRDGLGILGEDFRRPGEAMGTVTLKVGDVSTELPIISYSSIAIQARVPAEVNDIARREMPSVLEGGTIEGRIGVHTPRGTSVAAVRLVIPIDESLLGPKISFVYPREVQPGQRVSILGEKFLSREPGAVRFHFGSRTIDATVVDWTDWALLVELPADITGMRRASGVVEVENFVGRSDTCVAKPVTFVPAEVTEELVDTVRHSCRQHETWEETRVLFDFDLINGWRVVDRRMLDYCAGVASCSTLRYPQFGSSDPRYEVVGRCSRGSGFGGDACGCVFRLTIQGPRGLPYR